MDGWKAEKGKGNCADEILLDALKTHRRDQFIGMFSTFGFLVCFEVLRVLRVCAFRFAGGGGGHFFLSGGGSVIFQWFVILASGRPGYNLEASV